ncbi:FtsK/SpoIIIE domain-containing protein [Actinacidiphila glaucinigra]|uniref:FtsK/SpoIIIE domain-containing protein n=1 Tax=Actinacidiphila glaucinigra TaxID=235986 RepID=UPI0038669B5B
MSATSSDSGRQRYTALVAAALKGAAAKPQRVGRRLMLRGLHGLAPADLLPALLASGAVSVTVYPDGLSGQPRDITAARLANDTLLIPYLVNSDTSVPTGLNTGGEGFAAALRTHFLAGATEPRVLLILDHQPPETVLSTTEDAALLPELEWTQLARQAAMQGTPSLPAFVAAVVEDYLDRCVRSAHTNWQDAERLRDWVTANKNKPETHAGLAIPALGFYIADSRPTPRRLAKCADWRRDLDDWIASPSEDLARRLLLKRIPAEGAAKVLQSRSLRGMDYGGFTLDDLARSATGAPLDLDAVHPVSGQRLVLKGQQSLAVWMPASGGTLQFNLNRPLGRGESVSVRWQHESYATLKSQGRGALLNVAPPSVTQWRFGAVELNSPGGPVQRLRLALFFSDADIAGFERGLDVDPDVGGFVCADQPQIGVWRADGKELGTAQLTAPAPDNGDNDGLQLVTGLMQGSPVGPVPVLPRGAADPGEEEDASGPGSDLPEVEGNGADNGESDREDLDGDEDTGLEPDPLLNRPASGRGESLPTNGQQPTLAHAMLAFRQADWPTNASIPVTAGFGQQEKITASYGAQRVEVQPQIGKTSLLGPESLILQHPEGTAFRVSSTGAEVLQQLPQPEASWAEELKAFAGARRKFFELAAAAGSVFALDPRSPEASAYTSTYRALLEALPRTGASRTEYERLLLIDTTEVIGLPDLFVAPTNPLSIAFYADLANRFTELVGAGAEDLDKADLSAFSPQHLLPLIMADSSWHEAAPCRDAFLWRRYRPLDGSTPGALERNSSFIAGRIAFFLDVHPGMSNPESTIAVTFADPGIEPVLDAMREFYRKDLTRQTYTRPKLRVTLDGDADGIRHGVSSLVASAASDPLDRLVCTRSVIRHRPADEQDFSHLSFLFRSPGERKVRPVGLQRRAGTTFARALACTPGRVLIPDADPVFATGVFAPQPDQGSSDLEAIQYRCLELVGGQGGENLAPDQTRMVTVRTSDKTLSEWYGKSAWVVHLDRLVGLEAFTLASARRRAVLEYEERADPDSYGYDGITGTEYVGPYVAALNRALDGIATPDPRQAQSLMALLESVSGRWALQIVQRPQNKVLERAGTACAIRYAQGVEGTLDPAPGLRAIVSLEELVPSFPQAGVPHRLAATRKKHGAMCDDLLLVSVLPRDGRPPLVQMSVAEIKFWSEAPNYSDAAAQVEESNKWLADRFQNPGPLKDLRGRELAELIRSAVARNTAFELTEATRDDAEDLLQRVAQGDYELGFGHWRSGSYRRGMVVSVERNAPGTIELHQLNGPEGPVDVVSMRSAAVRSALRGEPLATPAGWHRLNPVPPDEAGAPAGFAPKPVAPSDLELLPNGRDSLAKPEKEADPAGTEDDGGEAISTASRLDSAFAKYGLAVEPFDPELAHEGPSVIRFRTRTLGKLSISDIERRARDISREVATAGEIVVGHEPGYVTIDVPRQHRQPVLLGEVLHELDKPAKPGALSFIAGIAPSGSAHIADLSRLPHLLVAGATGSGKSVFLRGLLIELLRSRTPEQLELIIIDPKRLDFAPFAKAPHVRNSQIISDADIALETLQSVLECELERRQPILEEAGVSSASEFYESGGTLEELPQLVILVDEFADLILSGSDRKAFSELIQRYAQLTRAYGIFLVLATQRPSVDVITGSIKANLSARMAFSLPSHRDSMTVLDQGGAENLLGDGDLLFYRNGKVERLQAPFAKPADVRAVLG